MSFRIFQNEKTTFQAKKTRRSKSLKIDIFPNGLTHDFGPKMDFFPTFSLSALLHRKMSLTIFQNEKTPFYAIRKRSTKRLKIDIFLKALTHAFRPKMAIFPTSFFQAIQTTKMPFTIFYNGKTPFQAIKTTTSKSRKIDIFPKGLTHGFGPKMTIFQTFFFR